MECLTLEKNHSGSHESLLEAPSRPNAGAKIYVPSRRITDMVDRFARRSSPDNFSDISEPTLGEFQEQSIINFTHGYASPDHLPADALAEISDDVILGHRNRALQYGPAAGLDHLREPLIEYLDEHYEIETTLDNLMITTGAKQGLDLICKAMIEPGDTVAVTSPTYGTGFKILQSHEAGILEVPVDENGMVVSELEASLAALEEAGEDLPKFIYDVPEFHNPTGVTMSMERRERLVELAEKYDMLLVEDAPYRALRFEGESVPPIKSLDEEGNVVFLGTYSKLICPGLRVGWMIADEEIIDRVLPLKPDGGTNPLSQVYISRLHENGYLEERAVEYAEVLGDQRDVMVEAIREHLPRADIWNVPEGGYYIWLELPEHVDTEVMYEIGKDVGVLFLPGNLFSPGETHKNFLRLAWAYEDPEQTIEGIKRMAEVIDAYEEHADSPSVSD